MKLSVYLEKNKKEESSAFKEYYFVKKDLNYSDLDALSEKKIIIGTETLIINAFYNPDDKCISVEINQNNKAIFELTSYISVHVSFITLNSTRVWLAIDDYKHT